MILPEAPVLSWSLRSSDEMGSELKLGPRSFSHLHFLTQLELLLKCFQPARENSIRRLQKPHYLFLYLNRAPDKHQSLPDSIETESFDKSLWEAKKKTKKNQIGSIKAIKKTLSSFIRCFDFLPHAGQQSSDSSLKLRLHLAGLTGSRCWSNLENLLSSTAQDRTHRVHSQALDSVILYGSPAGPVGGDLTPTTRRDTWKPWDGPAVPTAVTAGPLWRPFGSR